MSMEKNDTTTERLAFDVSVDAPLVLASQRSQAHLRIDIRAPRLPRPEARSPVSLGIVLDRSGSMHGDKIAKAREAAIAAVRTLEDRDRFNVVVYDEIVDMLVSASPATDAAKHAAELALQDTAARGTTDLHGGWLRSTEDLAAHKPAGATSRCLLMTDGLANRGVVDPNAIVSRVAELLERGVATSTFGVGADFDELLLQRMASAGAGNFHFIESAEEIPGFIVSEIGETLETVLSDATLVVNAPEGAVVRSLNEHPVTQEGRLSKARIGSLYSAQTLTCVLSVECPGGAIGERVAITVSLEGAGAELAADAKTVELEYADADTSESQPRNLAVDVEVARLTAAAASRDGLGFNKAQNYSMAGKVLYHTASRIRRQARGRRELLDVADELEQRRNVYEASMEPIARKLRSSRDFMDMKRGLRGDAYDTDRLRRRGLGAGEIVVVATGPTSGAVTSRAVHALSRQIGRLSPALRLTPTAVSPPGGREHDVTPLDRQEERQLAASLRRRLTDPSMLYVSLLRPLADNWFSHWLERERVVVSSLHGWQQTAAVPAEAFVAYEILLYAPYAITQRYDALSMAHQVTRGCLYDFCGERGDVEIKLQTMDVCPDCEKRLDDLGVNVQGLRVLCEVVRGMAIREVRAGA
jgi:hypothetical protein